MIKLIEYVQQHAQRGECQCGKCIDKGDKPDPAGHTADVHFFKVALNDSPKREEFEALVRENEVGEFATVDLFDGKEHGYIELGGWIGDQGGALMLMGIGALLGSWRLLTPETVFGKLVDKEILDRMAGMGMIAIQAEIVKTPSNATEAVSE